MHIAKIAFFMLVFQLVAQASSQAQQIFAAPVPSQILAAKKVFIANGGLEGFVSSDAYIGGQDRGYNQFYETFQKSTRFQLVATPAEADLVLEISTRIASDAQSNLRLTIYETKSHYVLWRMDSLIEIAARQVTFKRNFDTAVTRLASNFEKLAAPPQP